MKFDSLPHHPIQYDLVCGRAKLKDLAQSVYFAGMMVGIFIVGFCADRSDKIF